MRRPSSSVLLPVAMAALILGGCSTRSGWEYAGEEPQEVRRGNLLTQEQLATYPQNWSLAQVMVQGLPGLVLTSGSSARNRTTGSDGTEILVGNPAEYISLRGIGGAPALIVIDGVPMPEGSSTDFGLTPNDVQRIEVLRDAAQTALYGFRGEAGVILITTNRGPGT